MISIPFNKPPFFPDSFKVAIQLACDVGKFSGDGPNSKNVCKFFSETFGYDRSLLTPSCTASLEMAALILDLKPGDEVIVPAFTFVTSANAFALRGVTIVFADSEEGSPNVSVSSILSKVTEKTKAIVVVHYAGVPVDIHQILKETNHSIPVVEDCAHAIGSIDPRTGDIIGKAGCLSTFSFHETKNIGIGEGGLLVVNDPDLWRMAQMVREKGTNRVDFLNGKVDKYTWVSLGSSYLMSDIDAAMLWSALQHYQEIQDHRLAIWDHYDQTLAANSIFKKPPRDVRANAHMYYLEFSQPELLQDFSKALKEEGILVATHYIPLDTSPFIIEDYCGGTKGITDAYCTRAYQWSKALVRLPLFHTLTLAEMSKVSAVINSYTSAKGMTLVAATEDHWETIRILRNTDSECFLHTEMIEKAEHWNFMGKYHSTYRVAIEDGECIGFIGHVNKDARLATSAKSKGVAQFMWKTFAQEFDDLDVKVLVENKRCLAFFRKQGYVPDTNVEQNGPCVSLMKVQD